MPSVELSAQSHCRRMGVWLHGNVVFREYMHENIRVRFSDWYSRRYPERAHVRGCGAWVIRSTMAA